MSQTEGLRSTPSARLRLIHYALTVLLSSALVLVLEIVAARLVAPFVGVSLYSWTAIIGVILAGLSLGNWVGGVWADRGGANRAAGTALLLAALGAFAILLILPRIAEPLQSSTMSLASLSVILAGALFFAPAALLGIVTPLLTTLALAESQRPGHIVGLMHALAALGSILGTFATGFWLVQWIGSRNIVIATGLILLLLAAPLLHRTRERVTAVTGGLVVAALAASPAGYHDPCQRESGYFCLRVVDSSDQAPFGTARSLILDHLLHSTNHREAPELVLAPYLHLMDELAARHTEQRTEVAYFFAGGGAYTMPRAVLARNHRARITVAELDPVVTNLAMQRLFVTPKGFEILHMDARPALQRHPARRYDVVVGDVFHDVAAPYHLLTYEFAELVKRRLKPNGLYVINIVDAFPDAHLVRALHKTLSQSFAEVDIWIDRLPTQPTRVTYVFSARDQGGVDFADHIDADRGLPRTWYRITEPATANSAAMAEAPLLTDDYAPVERLVAQLFVGQAGR